VDKYQPFAIQISTISFSDFTHNSGLTRKDLADYIIRKKCEPHHECFVFLCLFHQGSSVAQWMKFASRL
jgi:hypothetical protein